jgi:hypothetical protein
MNTLFYRMMETFSQILITCLISCTICEVEKHYLLACDGNIFRYKKNLTTLSQPFHAPLEMMVV